MLNRRLAVLTATIAVALTALTGTASAALLSDLTALGYTVSAATQCENTAHVWVTVWYVSGYGIGTYLSECDPDLQANLDSIARSHCDRKWQFTTPEQVDPWSAIARPGWTETADKCGDVFTVTNPNDGTVRYSGPGSGLVELAASIGAPPVPPPPVVVPPPVPVETPAPAVVTPPAPTPVAPAVAVTPAPQPQPAAQVAATPEPTPTSANETVITAPTVTITMTPEQLKALIDSAVSKAVGKAMAKEREKAKRAARAQRPKPSSSHRKSQVRRR